MGDSGIPLTISGKKRNHIFKPIFFFPGGAATPPDPPLKEYMDSSFSYYLDKKNKNPYALFAGGSGGASAPPGKFEEAPSIFICFLVLFSFLIMIASTF